MRKITTIEEKEKKETRNKIIIGVILVAIMVVSTAGYAFFGTQKQKGSEKKIEYNGINFVLGEDNLWHFIINQNEFSTAYNPKETENISKIMALNLMAYSNKPLYFSYDSNRQGVEEIARNIERFAERTQYVCLENCSENFPVKNCSSTIIAVKEVNESLIKQEENCVYILTREEDVVRASDRFLFGILGVQ